MEKKMRQLAVQPEFRRDYIMGKKRKKKRGGLGAVEAFRPPLLVPQRRRKRGEDAGRFSGACLRTKKKGEGEKGVRE